jgi:hypothetical protein
MIRSKIEAVRTRPPTIFELDSGLNAPGQYSNIEPGTSKRVTTKTER